MPLELAVRLMLLLVLARSALNALEVLGSPRDFAQAGALSWNFLRLERDWTTRGQFAPLMGALLGPGGVVVLNSVQLTVVVLLAWPAIATQPIRVTLLWALLSLELLSDFRNRSLGRDGSDRMHLIVLVATTICCTLTDPRAKAFAVTFVALQAMLAYLTSGIVKALAPRWRRGEALRTVLMSENYGARRPGNLVTSCAPLGRVASWIVILFELCFAFVVLLGPGPTLLLLAIGLAFHLGVAAIMGLNSFVWSFAATYPAVFWLSIHLQSHS